jgi:hypothetical protein
LTEQEAALRLGVSVSRMRQLRYAGREPQPIKILNYRVRYELGEVDRIRRERLAVGGVR